MNTFTTVGRLTGTPVLKTINADTADEPQVCELSIAGERTGGRTNGDGNKPVDYFDIRVWGGRAEAHQKHLVQGQRIHISGEIRQERWTDRDSGQKRSRHVVIARETEWLDKPKGSATTSSDEAPADSPEDEAF